MTYTLVILFLLTIKTMNIAKIDLNLLIYLDVLLREKNVTRSASQLNITQPAMSNGLKRLRNLFNDPILVRTSDGMVPTERARALAPVIRKILLELEEALQGEEEFNEKHSQRVFRIMASDYAASTLLPSLLRKIKLAPDVKPHDNVSAETPTRRFDSMHILCPKCRRKSVLKESLG